VADDILINISEPSPIEIGITLPSPLSFSLDAGVSIHNILSGLQGGITDQFYHLTAAEYAAKFLHDALTDLQGGVEDEHYHLSAAEYAALGAPHNSLAGLQGGAAGQFYHMTAADYAARILGTGTAGYISNFIGANSLGNSPIFTDGTYIFLNRTKRMGSTNNATGKLQIDGDIDIGKNGAAAQIRFWTYPDLNPTHDAYIQVQNYLLSFGNRSSLGDGYGDMVLIQGGTFLKTNTIGNIFNVKGCINSNGTAGYNGLNIDVTETAVGTGAKNLINARVNGVSKFSVSNKGQVNLIASAAAADSASLKIDAGVVASVPVSGNVESDGAHLYWTDSGGTRRQLDN